MYSEAQRVVATKPQLHAHHSQRRQSQQQQQDQAKPEDRTGTGCETAAAAGPACKPAAAAMSMEQGLPVSAPLDSSKHSSQWSTAKLNTQEELSDAAENPCADTSSGPQGGTGSLWPALIIMLHLTVLRSFNGFVNIMYFTALLFSSTGNSTRNSLLAQTLMGVSTLLGGVAAMLGIDRVSGQPAFNLSHSCGSYIACCQNVLLRRRDVVELCFPPFLPPQ